MGSRYCVSREYFAFTVAALLCPQSSPVYAQTTPFEPPPSFEQHVDAVSIASNHLGDSTLAVPGDTVTVSFHTSVSPLITPTFTIGGHATTSVLSGQSPELPPLYFWTASVVMQSGDTSGPIVFSADIGDAVGAITTTIAETNDGSLVTFQGGSIDTTPPVITLNGDASTSLAVGQSFIDPGATATDNVDGDITSHIIVGGDVVDTSAAGTYTITYNVSDAAGNNALP
jgi:hypothetical protein